MQRISRWKIAEAGRLDPDARYYVDFRFRLDMSQLPRPLQIGVGGQADWNIAVMRNQRLASKARGEHRTATAPTPPRARCAGLARASAGPSASASP